MFCVTTELNVFEVIRTRPLRVGVELTVQTKLFEPSVTIGCAAARSLQVAPLSELYSMCTVPPASAVVEKIMLYGSPGIS